MVVGIVSALLAFSATCGPCCRNRLSGSLHLRDTSDDLAGATHVVLITGASSGIGEELAKQYAARGVRLVLVARRQAELDRVAAACRAAGAAAVLPQRQDFSLPEDIVAVLNRQVALIDSSIGLIG